MIIAAKEYNIPDTHSMDLRPSQSAAGPAIVTLATAPNSVEATTKPSRAGAVSKWNSGLRYRSAPGKTPQFEAPFKLR